MLYFWILLFSTILLQVDSSIYLEESSETKKNREAIHQRNDIDYLYNSVSEGRKICTDKKTSCTNQNTESLAQMVMASIKDKGYQTDAKKIQFCITESKNNKILHAYFPLSSQLNRSLERMFKKHGLKVIRKYNGTDCMFNEYGIVVSETINGK